MRVDCATSEARVAVPASGNVTVLSATNRTIHVDVGETGHALEVTSPGPHLHLPIPYRYGLDVVELAPGASLRINRALTTNQAVTATLSIDCKDDPASSARRAWLGALAELVPTGISVPADQADTMLARAGVLVENASTPADAAIAWHLRSQITLFAGRSADAVAAFAAAEARWRAIGDSSRARVALVARVEELQRISRNEEALAIAEKVPPKLAKTDYFAARLRLSRCLVWRYLGRMEIALECFREGIANMAALGEKLDLVSALQDMTDVSAYLGDLVGAKRFGQQLLLQATLPAMEVHRGRIQLTLADLSMESGDLIQALQHFDAALGEFAASGFVRWEANAMLRTAEFYIALGALDEASDLVASALSRLSPKDAPARIAAGRTTQARIDAQRGHYTRARSELAEAESTYRELKMIAELDTVELTSARVALQEGDTTAAKKKFDARDLSQSLNRDAWTVVGAMIDASEGNCARTEKALRTLEGRPLAPAYAIDRAESTARCQAINGHYALAQAKLLRDADNIAALASRLGNPLLRKVLLRNIEPLRRTAFRLAFTETAPSPEIDLIWRWLRLDDDETGITSTPTDIEGARLLDAEIARELLPHTGRKPSANAPRHLLDLLATTAAQPVAASRPVRKAFAVSSIDALQRRLPEGCVYISYVDAGARSHLLWITRYQAKLLPTVQPARLDHLAESLLSALSSTATPLDIIDANAEHLSRELLTSISGETPPTELLVDSSSRLAVLPWSILRWPGNDTPLLETTRASLVRIDDGMSHTTETKTRLEVAVFVAPQTRGGELTFLPNAIDESEFVAEGLRARGGHVTQFKATDRASLMAAFMRPHPWLHIAAHGSAQPSRIGYSGIWLEPASEKDEPRFISWLEVLSRGASTELVVLNACRLAQQVHGSPVGLSFADALSRAGVRDVIAGRWLLSDAATAQWVPEFYRKLSEHESPATALWNAQRVLRTGRFFRHPFYWASYVHFGRI